MVRMPEELIGWTGEGAELPEGVPRLVAALTREAGREGAGSAAPGL